MRSRSNSKTGRESSLPSKMVSGTKRAWKLQEFVAHGANVNCLSLGRKSGRVLVTGGDDKKVNLWAVGKPNCIMSLSGHTTPVECVRFGHTEELVCAGSLSGALKIWDLEAAKIVRTLTGHKANIRCVDFHPYGDFLASGSQDTSIKLWDTRRKGCIFTYKGHNLAVNSLKFSPDGQWVASAGEDCYVKLWDLRVGKMLTEFHEHNASVIDVEFHPHEFLLASGSMDRVVHFWDLESFQLVSSTDGDCLGVRCIFFNPEGECLFSGTQDMLKVYGWEPARTFDTIYMGWGKVQDIATAQNQLIGASYHLSNVALFVVDMKRIQPFGNVINLESNTSPFKYGTTIRKSFIKEKPGTAAVNSFAMKSQAEESDTNTATDPEDNVYSGADIKDPEDYRMIFHPRNRDLSRTPPPPEQPFTPPLEEDPFMPQIIQPPLPEEPPKPHSGSPSQRRSSVNYPPLPNQTITSPPHPPHQQPSKVTCFRGSPPLSHQPQPPGVVPYPRRDLAQAGRDSGSSGRDSGLVSASSLSSKEPTPEPHVDPVRGRVEQRREHLHQSFSDVGNPYSSGVEDDDTNVETIRLSAVHHSPSDPVLNRQDLAQPRSSSLNRNSVPQCKQDMQSIYGKPVEMPSTRPGYSKPLEKPAVARPIPQKPDIPVTIHVPENSSPPTKMEPIDYVPSLSDKPVGLDLEEFLPRKFQTISGLGFQQQVPELSESEVFSSIMRGHESMMAVLGTRQRNLQIVHTMWNSKDAKTSVESAISMNDQAVIVDLLGVINLRSSVWNLDLCQMFLPTLGNLIQSKYENYMDAGCNALRLILKNFASVIKTNIRSPIQTVGVDISREERYNKCMTCYKELVSIRAFVLKRQTVQGKLGHTFRELAILLEALD